MSTTEQVSTRPRVEGDREQEILRAVMTVLEDVGYDRLTFDAVAAQARASKATLYRRWNDKVHLVTDALRVGHPAHVLADTGSLRGDLLATYCGMGGLDDERSLRSLGAVITAVLRDPEFAQAFRDRFIAPKAAASRELFERAVARGEIGSHIDLDLVAPTVAGVVMQHVFAHGTKPDAALVERVVDEIVMPAVMRPAPGSTPDSTVPPTSAPSSPAHDPQHTTRKDPA